MLIFHHLFLGLIVGIMLAVILSNKWAVLYGGIGGILPDLLDKPLGQILLAETMNWGRIYAHTLIISVILIIIGLLIWYKNRKRILLLCIGAGVLIHQLGDAMWTAPVNWFWPFLGPFPPSSEVYPPIPDGYLPYLYLASWILAVIAGAAVITVLHRHLGHYLAVGTVGKRILTGTGMVLTGAGTILLIKYLIWDLFLTGPWANYFGTMYLHELLSISEWIYGLTSLILILLLLDYPVRFSQTTKKRIIRICGAGVVGVSLLLMLCIGLGVPADEVYGETIWRILAAAGLFCGGIVLLFLGDRIWALPDDRVSPK
ncbi:MAG: metal-dependent hydrolase [Methanocorpusculum sp.]|uniref:metal-dependent hydrolase n=1 Tax=Methanocorpusculum sp. TaxID=2058474 RepID=UPI002B1E9F1B|nr:metal-dependent hydrolase [Methanocorpusculum sp.]MEA5086436.1 metal-dependent hydrolase [Methanocorpusculum sp.]